jgi:hypothetical protein
LNASIMRQQLTRNVFMCTQLDATLSLDVRLCTRQNDALAVEFSCPPLSY